jgi:hypothetical protein
MGESGEIMSNGRVKMTKQEFKQRWESNEDGGGITFDDIAECAKAWGLASKPRIMQISHVRYMVLKAANTNDAEEFLPDMGY